MSVKRMWGKDFVSLEEARNITVARHCFNCIEKTHGCGTCDFNLNVIKAEGWEDVFPEPDEKTKIGDTCMRNANSKKAVPEVTQPAKVVRVVPMVVQSRRDAERDLHLVATTSRGRQARVEATRRVQIF